MVTTVISLLLFALIQRVAIFEIGKAAKDRPRPIHLLGLIPAAFIGGILLLASASPHMDTEETAIAWLCFMLSVLLCGATYYLAARGE